MFVLFAALTCRHSARCLSDHPYRQVCEIPWDLAACRAAREGTAATGGGWSVAFVARLLSFILCHVRSLWLYHFVCLLPYMYGQLYSLRLL